MIRVTVWNENIHDREVQEVKDLYPLGIHGTLAAYLNTLEGVEAAPPLLEQPEAACRRGAEQHGRHDLVGALRPPSRARRVGP